MSGHAIPDAAVEAALTQARRRLAAASPLQNAPWLSRLVDEVAEGAVAAALPHLTPEPRVITTAEEMEALPAGIVVRSDAGTIACRYDERRGVVFGDERPFPWGDLALPATVLHTPKEDR